MRRALWVVMAGALTLGTGCIRSALHSVPPEARQAIVAEVEWFQSDGDDIRVDVYRPLKAGRHPAAIFLHGSNGLHFITPNTANRYAEAMAEIGIASFVVHYFDGTGHVTADAQEERDNYFRWVKEVRDALSWVRKRPDVIGSRISLVGVSLGAWVAVGVGAQDAGVYRMALFGGGLEPFLADSIHRMPPILMFHGRDDDIVPLSDAQHLVDFLVSRRFPVQLQVYPGEEHTLSDSAANDAINQIAKFIAPRGTLSLDHHRIPHHWPSD